MGCRLSVAVLGALAAATTQAAWAGQAAEGTADQRAALTKCISLKTTGADRMLTARWLFAMMSKSPQIADLSTVTAERTKELNQSFAKLFTRLITQECTAEVRPIAAGDFEDAFALVGSALGETAMIELMSGKEVERALSDYADFISEDDFKAFVESLPKKAQ